MSAAPEVLRVVRQWIEKAEHDLRTAEHTLTLGEDCPFDTVCFHAQQCAEKHLKALLTFHGVDFPKTHDLTELVALLPPSARPLIPSTELVDINPYAIETRYPGDWEPQNREDALRALEIA
jgi:HEPN domain-containing protein